MTVTWNLGQEALQRGDWRGALRMLMNCKPEAMQQLEYLKLFSCCYIQAGSWKDVANISASAAQRFPSEAIFFECWAWAEYMQGETATAVQILESVVARFRDRENVAYLLACLHAAQQNYPDAQRYLATAEQLSTDPVAFALKASKQKEFSALRNAEEMAFAG